MGESVAKGVSRRYRRFAEYEAAGSSPSYERTALAVADDDALVGKIGHLPVGKQQPNLLFAACRYLGVEFEVTPAVIDAMHGRWADISEVMLTHSTQTNEPARAAVFLPLLAQLEGPVALIEVGASAGLCLYPDRYLIRYDGRDPVGPPDSSVVLDVATEGPLPEVSRVPDIAWRAGCDLSPLDVSNSGDLAWLVACVWPEHSERRDRVITAARLVAEDPPELIVGDLVESIDELLGSVPVGATPVVIHSAVLGYVPVDRRQSFARRLEAHPEAIWLSNEGPGVVDALTTTMRPPASATSRAFFILGRGGENVVAISDPHGSWLKWADDTGRDSG